MLQSSQCMALSTNARCNHLLSKQIDALESKKHALSRKIDHQQHKINISSNAKQETSTCREKMREIQKAVRSEEIKLQKYKLRKIDLESEKLSQIIQFQHLQLQLQAIKNQLLAVFTPAPSRLQELRLMLISIQSNAQLMKFSNHFSIRKAIIRFLKIKRVNINELGDQPIQLQISKRGLVSEFREFVDESLKNKKLSEFRKIFSQPLERYLEILEQAEQMLFDPGNTTNTLEDEQKRQQSQAKRQEKQGRLIVEWNDKKISLLNKKLRIQSLEMKLAETLEKITKYEASIKEDTKQKNEIQKKLNYYSKINYTQNGQDRVLPSLNMELQQLNQAITYLTEKRNNKKNNVTLDSPHSKGLIDTLDHSNISKNLTLQNCQSVRSHFLSQSSKKSKLSLFKSPKRTAIKDKSMKTLKIFSSPYLK